jgi:hypothetical protein
MRRILVFDLLYLKDFKQETFKSDFDELQFTISLILDVTRALAERETALAGLHNDTIKMSKAFLKLKDRIGIIVPFERCIRAFWTLFDEERRKKLGIQSEDEIFVGTPDMFRGVEKELIIISSVRNSVVDGLGQFNSAELTKLAMTRSRSMLWVVGSSITLMGQTTPGA